MYMHVNMVVFVHFNFTWMEQLGNASTGLTAMHRPWQLDATAYNSQQNKVRKNLFSFALPVRPACVGHSGRLLPATARLGSLGDR